MTWEMDGFDFDITKVEDVTVLNGDDILRKFEVIFETFFCLFKKPRVSPFSLILVVYIYQEEGDLLVIIHRLINESYIK